MSKTPILIASGTANTARSTVEDLSAAGTFDIRVMTRSPGSDKAKTLGSLPNVTIVKGDLNDGKSVDAALVGVTRAMLVSGAGEHEQFDREADFLTAAKAAGLEAVVRISTCTALIHPGSRGVYARAHASLEAFIEYHDLPVVDLNPNWYLDNWLGSAGEAKASGQLTLPTTGEAKWAMIDVRDVGHAASAILSTSNDQLQMFLKARNIQVHGPELVSFQDKAAAIGKAVGYDIKVNTIPREVFVGVLQGFGMSKLFAESFADTIRLVGGEAKPMGASPQTSSKLLFGIGWKPRHSLADFAASDKVKAAFAK